MNKLNLWSKTSQQMMDREYEDFMRQLNVDLESAINTSGQLFVADVPTGALWEAYLKGFSRSEIRQHHNCNTCRNFIERFGSLVTITDSGDVEPVLWRNILSISGLYARSATFLRAKVLAAPVRGVFLCSEKVWGTPKSGGWDHLHVTPPKKGVRQRDHLTDDQAMAEKRQDYQTLSRALAMSSTTSIQQAVTLLRSDALYRAEKVLGQAEFLLALKTASQSRANPILRSNVIWRAVATAPAGFCHPRSSVIGSLLEDLQAGMPVELVKRRFDEKMHPERYQRPQTPPSAGNIARAEAIFERLGLAPALERRYASPDEVPMIWRWSPKIVRPGVFSHLLPQDQPVKPGVARRMTFRKFRETILPTAEKIEVPLDRPAYRFGALTTAVHADAPRLLQWDREDGRNPVAWYTYGAPTPVEQWRLTWGSTVRVLGITEMPHQWSGDYPNHTKGVLILLDGARDKMAEQIGLALFPEILISDLHEVRSTIEAHSQTGRLADPDGMAAGLLLHATDQDVNITLLVTSAGIVNTYHIDRWD